MNRGRKVNKPSKIDNNFFEINMSLIPENVVVVIVEIENNRHIIFWSTVMRN